jgi:hypothetical protein
MQLKMVQSFYIVMHLKVADLVPFVIEWLFCLIVGCNWLVLNLYSYIWMEIFWIKYIFMIDAVSESKQTCLKII